jgi:hypothetical protein
MYLVKVDDPGTKTNPNPGFNPNLLVATTPAEAWPGLTTQLDLPLDPISGTGCEDPAVPARPELLQVSRPYVNATDSGAARQITIKGDFIGTAGPANATGGRVTLTDVRTGAVMTLTRASGGGIVSWQPGSGSTPDQIVIQVPLINVSTFRPGPKQLTIITANANGGVSSVNGITIHVLGSTGGGSTNVTYNPPVVNVPPPAFSGPNAHAIQNAIDAAVPGSLLVLSPGVYNENVLLWKPLKLQGVGLGGIIGAHEFQARDPEDPRFNVPGSVIDGRYFAQNAAAYDATVSSYGPFVVDANLPDILRGADITVVAKTTSAYGSPSAATDFVAGTTARIDGIGLTTGSGTGAGGVQVQAHANNLQITNNVLENNGGVVAGGISVGQPYAHTSHNYRVRILNNRVLGNGGLTQAGGIGLFYDSNNYEVAGNIVCSNFSVNYGAGVSHIGLSPNGSIHDNQIYYNESVDSGAGVAIESELPVGGGLGDGSGTVNLDNNLIQSNYSGDDGGGIFVLDALKAAINIRNNMVVDNGASDLGGAIMLDDSSNVRIINNTVANNVSTGSSESSDGLPHGAGLTSESNSPVFQAMLPNRTDSGTMTNTGRLVFDPAVVAGDLGRIVTGPGIPTGTASNPTRIVSVSPGVSFSIGGTTPPVTRYATATASGVSVVISRTDTGAQITSGSNVVRDNSITAADVGRLVTITAGGGGFSANRTITSVNTATSPRTFTINANATQTGTRTIVINKTDSNATTNDGSFIRDAATVLTDVGSVVTGPGIRPGDPSIIVAATPGVGFEISRTVDTTASGVTLTLTRPDFADPVALFNNIFWNNNAFTLSQPGPGATLVNQGFIDFEVHGTTRNADTFVPRFSNLTNGQNLGPDGVLRPVPGGQANIIGSNPGFVLPFILELTVSGSRADPQTAAVTITGADPPVGLTGDYHISLPNGLVARVVAAAGSAVIDRGARCADTPTPANNSACTSGSIAAPTVDYDNQGPRGGLNFFFGLRSNTRWDIGADESSVLP